MADLCEHCGSPLPNSVPCYYCNECGEPTMAGRSKTAKLSRDRLSQLLREKEAGDA